METTLTQMKECRMSCMDLCRISRHKVVVGAAAAGGHIAASTVAKSVFRGLAAGVVRMACTRTNTICCGSNGFDPDGFHVRPKIPLDVSRLSSYALHIYFTNFLAQKLLSASYPPLTRQC